MAKEQLDITEWTESARTYQKLVNAIYDEAHSIQDALDLDED